MGHPFFCILVCSYRSNTPISKIPETKEWKLCFSKTGSSGKEAHVDTSLASCCACSVVSCSLRPHGLQPARLLCPWPAARQAPLSMACSPPGSSVHGLQPSRLLCPWAFSRQEYWDELSFPLPGDLPDPGIEPVSPSSFVVAGGFFTTEPPGKPSLALDNTKSITPAWQRLFPASNHLHTPGGPSVHQNFITSFGKEAERLPGLWSRNI